MDLDAWGVYISDTLDLSVDEFVVERLTGGLINSTVRVTLCALPASLPGGMADLASVSFPGHAPTLVLKHAPPYVATDPDQPLSVFRQTAEARALSHLAADAGLCAALAAPPAVVVPRLVFHDEAAHVLWMSDLGERVTLRAWLDGDKRVGEADEPPGLPHSASFAAQIGRHIGTALAQLHLAGHDPPPSLLAEFKDPDSNGPGEIVAMLTGTTRAAMTKRGYADAEALSARIGLGTGPKPSDGKSVWCMADLWTGSVLLPLGVGGGASAAGAAADIGETALASAGADADAAAALALVDWEFAGAAHPGAEVGMLLAHVRVGGRRACEPFAESRADALARALGAGYVSTAPQLSRTRAFRRQALCAYGRELAHCATEAPNVAAAPALVDEAVAALRAAGDDDNSTLPPGTVVSPLTSDPAPPAEVMLDTYLPH